MVFLGRVERCGGDDLGMDFLEFPASQQRIAAAFGDFAFRRVLPVDAAAILAAAVTELPVLRRRVNVVPEMDHQLCIADLGRIVGHPDRFRVPGAASADLFVAWIGRFARGVARLGTNDPWQFFEIRLGAPEAKMAVAVFPGLTAGVSAAVALVPVRKLAATAKTPSAIVRPMAIRFIMSVAPEACLRVVRTSTQRRCCSSVYRLVSDRH